MSSSPVAVCCLQIQLFQFWFSKCYVLLKDSYMLFQMTQHDINFVAEFLRDSFAQFTPVSSCDCHVIIQSPR